MRAQRLTKVKSPVFELVSKVASLARRNLGAVALHTTTRTGKQAHREKSHMHSMGVGVLDL
jgi:hypothetical protein